MEIGILTFHFSCNFGGVLQCYALQKFLISSGHNVKIINYIPPNSKSLPYWRQFVNRKLTLADAKKILKKIQYAPTQKAEFNLFRKNYINLTDSLSYKQLSSITNEFDAIIVGSDQIWNPSQHKIGSYFLLHLEKFSGRRISYAPCCALNKIDSKNRLHLKDALSKFYAISVRNKETEEFVYNLLGISPPIVVDPTLLWNFEEFISKKPLINEHYILVYILGKEINGGHANVIESLKSKFVDTKIISVIQTENNPQLFDWSDLTYWHANPIVWLNLIYHASFIYTDSFHGVLFSIKFKKQFLAYYSEKARASRFIDLLDRFESLDKSIVESYSEAIRKSSFDEIINYEYLHKNLETEIQKSILFINNSLSSK